ncbi:Uncharacterised protein [Klebsiella pneumoniae subsp. ozaenae]|uniref:Uncharacterized protein n=1 Tax=Klebsiella pneumoniae subsp. ozaenae TaxID=574 RepID=A0A378B0N8_KLEPO|nr:Uncharacterised protein [Klebsiella pneumoniae subsp. ozaenae]
MHNGHSPNYKTAGERNFDLIQGTNLYKVNQLNNTRDFAQMDSIQPLSDVLENFLVNSMTTPAHIQD